jgi:excisionase family DNA binding protein
MLVEVTEKPIAYKPDEAARLMGISPRKLDELIGTRQIRTFKVGKARRVTRAAINEYIAQQEKLAAR